MGHPPQGYHLDAGTCHKVLKVSKDTCPGHGRQQRLSITLSNVALLQGLEKPHFQEGARGEGAKPIIQDYPLTKNLQKQGTLLGSNNEIVMIELR